MLEIAWSYCSVDYAIGSFLGTGTFAFRNGTLTSHNIKRVIFRKLILMEIIYLSRMLVITSFERMKMTIVVRVGVESKKTWSTTLFEITNSLDCSNCSNLRSHLLKQWFKVNMCTFIRERTGLLDQAVVEK